MNTRSYLAQLVESEIAGPLRAGQFSALLESRYQQDIDESRRRHLSLALLIGVCSYNGFLYWVWLMLNDVFAVSVALSVGVATPVALATVVVLRRKIRPGLRELIALVPFYVALVTAFIAVLASQQPDRIMVVFSWPLILIFVNTCLKSPLRLVLIFNAFMLLTVGTIVLLVNAPSSLVSLIFSGACATAFFSMLANHWLHRQERRSYLYSLRELLRSERLSTANRTLQQLSETDSLTGLANRRHLWPYLESLWAEQPADVCGPAVLLLDVDYFKAYNDRYGHIAGDECLCRVASALRRAVPPGQQIARFGGEEFIVILENATPQDTQRLAEQMLESIHALAIPHLGRQDGKRHLTLSIGIAWRGLPGINSAQALLDSADRALYSAKRHGRDQFRQGLVEPLADATSTLEHLDQLMPHDLEHAAQQRQFHLHLQPIFADNGKRLVGYESLLRWQHPHYGNIPPASFIPLAEACGLITELGDWVLNEACVQASQWPGDTFVAVNISPRQFDDPAFVERLLDTLARSGLAPTRLVLEVTEGVSLRIDAALQSNFARLRQHGIRLALDDFGSGYANLTYLLQLPFQWLKIDRGVLLIRDPVQRRQVLAALLALGQAFNLQVLCEGVELQEDLELVQALGIPLAQGYLLGRPGPLASFVEAPAAMAG